MKLRNIAGIAAIAIVATGCGSTDEPAEMVTLSGSISTGVTGMDAYKYTSGDDCKEDGTTGIYQRGSKVTAKSESGEILGEGSLLSAEYTFNPQLGMGTCKWQWGVLAPKIDGKYTLVFEGGLTYSPTYEQIMKKTNIMIAG